MKLLETKQSQSSSRSNQENPSQLGDWITLARPKQWIKNLVVFSGVLFTGDFRDLSLLMTSLIAFGLFCVLSSVGYIFNDTLDVERDKAHPVKCKRPIASGRIKPGTALCVAVLMAAGSLAAAFVLNRMFFLVAASYFAITLTYSWIWKHQVILDILVITAGFVMRALAGTTILDIALSPWLFVCVSLLALMLGFGKRRHELLLLEEGANSHRPVLSHYSPQFLDQTMSMTSSAAIVTYAVYAISSETAHRHSWLVATVPIVLYCILRYNYLIFHKKLGGQPEELFLTDRPLLAAVFLWGITILVIFTFNH